MILRARSSTIPACAPCSSTRPVHTLALCTSNTTRRRALSQSAKSHSAARPGSRGSPKPLTPCASSASSAAPTQPSSQPQWELAVPTGRVVIRPIQPSDVEGAGVVLTRAFSGTSEAVSLTDVLADINGLLDESSQGLCLVARLYPTDPTAPGALPPGQDSRLVGTACVSLSADAQPIHRLPPVNRPPPGAAYVSNMAVDAKFRRQGIAKALLAACEEVARQAGDSAGGGAGAGAGAREAWLHVREADAPARALYDRSGYGAVTKDTWLQTVQHKIKPRVLMRRAL
ncbi:hypothetical protein HYH03_008831 [Edaphochlamys debaryana]|uniref:N-acetyltransferase domain-containing protein n=1 Tax=Edaphochlamys debaryana TaxID=47281 RepID=A0A835XZ37_9CHLO|nr:hypothetical protein HYH03_008831 [Edaphochlamys debaryana]|eukprot:KAG2492918.1 hypothetical protein HYH03_008831 [Edaphochlamys debaryana]